MSIGEIYHFLFQTYLGVGCLVGAVLVVTFVLAIVFERKTRKRYVDRGFRSEEDDWNNPDYED